MLWRPLIIQCNVSVITYRKQEKRPWSVYATHDKLHFIFYYFFLWLYFCQSLKKTLIHPYTRNIYIHLHIEKAMYIVYSTKECLGEGGSMVQGPAEAECNALKEEEIDRLDTGVLLMKQTCLCELLNRVRCLRSTGVITLALLPEYFKILEILSIEH